jgi:hypothetical protein
MQNGMEELKNMRLLPKVVKRSWSRLRAYRGGMVSSNTSGERNKAQVESSFSGTKAMGMGSLAIYKISVSTRVLPKVMREIHTMIVHVSSVNFSTCNAVAWHEKNEPKWTLALCFRLFVNRLTTTLNRDGQLDLLSEGEWTEVAGQWATWLPVNG